ncbi:lysine--tRNA ligase-like isoform X2 [Vigna radiata var. radiata]|uniref:Lysine--tRNA ligase-like isoform X2 n=1 Tax=Vigna radiata var. radiata TaxID=3916 RepID=A0A3Q0EPU9_VIGRR|nr:lysine--tRNA ligase-like isoform X2 [Vigna radiata var. radiata]
MSATFSPLPFLRASSAALLSPNAILITYAISISLLLSRKNHKDVQSFAIFTKSLLSLPDKYHGLTDIDKRYRQRYVDMIANPEVAGVFRKRAKIAKMMWHEFYTVFQPCLRRKIEGTDLNSHFSSPNLGRTEVMANEGTPEFYVDQNMYYPTSNNYGYYCTGFETPGEWEDHHRIYGVDGPNVQYAGAQNESLPYVYYSYGYAQFPHNPYNPYIPGAMIGIDGSFGGGQHYYTLPNYQNPVSASGYIPIIPPDTL